MTVLVGMGGDTDGELRGKEVGVASGLGPEVPGLACWSRQMLGLPGSGASCEPGEVQSGVREQGSLQNSNSQSALP